MWRVEIDADARPFQPGGNLFDMRRLAGTVVALHHHAAVERKPGEDGERRIAVEDVAGVEVGHTLVGFAECRHHHVGIDAEHLAHADLQVGARP